MKLYSLQFFIYNEAREFNHHLCAVKASEIPKRGQLVYLGDDNLLNDNKIYLIKRVVRCYSGKRIDSHLNDGDQLTDIEIEVLPTKIGLV